MRAPVSPFAHQPALRAVLDRTARDWGLDPRSLEPHWAQACALEVVALRASASPAQPAGATIPEPALAGD